MGLFVYMFFVAIGLIWALRGLGLLIEAVLYKFSAFENNTINRGGYINDGRLS
jgi:hypothetical protein